LPPTDKLPTVEISPVNAVIVAIPPTDISPTKLAPERSAYEVEAVIHIGSDSAPEPIALPFQ